MEITIPTSWDDITLQKYINLRPILNTEMSDIQRVINILCVLTGEKKEVIKNVSLDDYHKIKKKLAFLNTELPNTLKNKRFKIGSHWYEFKLDAKKLLFGEYINNMEILQDAKDNQEVIFNNLHKILTTICRPIEKKRFRWRDVKVTGEVVRETADNFLENMPISIAYPIGIFFYNHLATLTRDIKTSLIAKAKRIMKESKAELDSLSVGVGGQH